MPMDSRSVRPKADADQAVNERYGDAPAMPAQAATLPRERGDGVDGARH